MNQPAYLDTNLSIPERVQDLLSRLTLEEKVGLMNHPAHGIPRLNIPAYNYWSEALHGVARNGRATVFPQAIGMAATWDKELIHQVATAISDEGPRQISRRLAPQWIYRSISGTELLVAECEYLP